MTPTSIETRSGLFVDLVNPDPATITIQDIAWAISRMPRYVGHTTSTIPYTIGQHSIFVLKLVDNLFDPNGLADLRRSFFAFVDEQQQNYEHHAVHFDAAVDLLNGGALGIDQALALELLLHDASEAYLVDVPTPLKQADGFREVYAELEVKMMNAIRTKLNMQALKPEHEIIVKWADRAALTIETFHLIYSRGRDWTRLMQLDNTCMQLFDEPVQPIDVYQAFLTIFQEITRQTTRA